MSMWGSRDFIFKKKPNERGNHYPFWSYLKRRTQSIRIINTSNTVHTFRCSTENFKKKEETIHVQTKMI